MAQDLIIPITIAGASVAKHKDNFFLVHPNIETLPDGSPKHTDLEWFQECVVRIVRREVKRGHTAKHYADIEEYNVDDIT